VSAVVVHDQMNIERFWDGGVDIFKKAQELLMPLPVV
jgi:hypothetical protein